MLSSQSLLPTKIPSSAANPRTLILHRCKSRRELNQIHAQLIKTRLHLNPSLAENLLESAAVLLPGSMDYALSIFRKMDEPDASAYNVIIRGFTLKQLPDQALTLFAEMLEGSVEPDDFTFPCALKACARLRASGEGKQVHALVVKLGCWSLGFVGNSLAHMYASCGETGIARRVFDGMPDKDVVAWNALFAGYCKMGRWEEVVKLFREMQGVAAPFDEVTLVSVLTACGRLADVELGEWVSQCMDRNGWKKDLALVTALIDMYAKCGKVDTARRLFDQMSRRDVVAWSAMISGYSQGRRCKEALDLFHEMLMVDVEPNEITLVSVLSSCAVLGALETGKWVHLYVKKRMMKMTVTLGTALMDCYLKCGSIDEAIEVFGMMPQKNVFSWTVLIQGLANNGQGKKAIEFFRVMKERNIKPNDVTFIGVLSACSHAGLVDEGREFFVSMSRDFSIEPQIEHFGCMVDILGRAGLIQEVYQFITNMPVLPNAVVWRTLLASCRAHKNIEMGEESLKRIAQLGPLHSGDHILMSNIYASVGRWEDAVRVRTEMKENGIKKMPGCTLIELNGEIYEFLSEDNKHTRSAEVYEASETMMQRIKLAGYIPNSIDARLDAEDDDKESALAHHSEKLAIAFGLIKTPPGATIRIFKNLRVCTDCHNATKIISKVYNREIVVRDWNRFHHFKNGSCSCNDYW